MAHLCSAGGGTPALRAALQFIPISAAIVESKRDRTKLQHGFSWGIESPCLQNPVVVAMGINQARLVFSRIYRFTGFCWCLTCSMWKEICGEADPATASSRGLLTAAVFPDLQLFWRVLGKRLNYWLGFQRTKNLSWSQWWWQGVYKQLFLLILK